MEKLTITVLGKSTVGKSSLTYKFLEKDMPPDCDPTIEDKYKKEEIINGKNVEINVLDTAGEEDYQNFIDNWISEGDCFLLVFAVNDKESFDLIEEKYRKVKLKKNKEVHIIVIANKIDLIEERTVDEKMCKELCDKLNVEYLETSAKDGINCKEAFINIANKVLTKVEKFDTSDKKKDDSNDKKGCCCAIF